MHQVPMSMQHQVHGESTGRVYPEPIERITMYQQTLQTFTISLIWHILDMQKMRQVMKKLKGERGGILPQRLQGWSLLVVAADGGGGSHHRQRRCTGSSSVGRRPGSGGAAFLSPFLGHGGVGWRGGMESQGPNDVGWQGAAGHAEEVAWRRRRLREARARAKEGNQ
jgi:hypothetical protein